jgi:Rrf2 family protein
MQISTRGRYGLRAMFELAEEYGRAPVLMSTVAERQGLSRKYLHALLTALKNAGLVRSVRGAGGGFTLSRPPAEIRLSEVLRVLEGPLAFVECVVDERACDRANRCPARQVWRRLADALDGVLENVTLEDLVTPENSNCSPRTKQSRGRAPRAKRGKSRTSRVKSHTGQPKRRSK